MRGKVAHDKVQEQQHTESAYATHVNLLLKKKKLKMSLPTDLMNQLLELAPGLLWRSHRSSADTILELILRTLPHTKKKPSCLNRTSLASRTSPDTIFETHSDTKNLPSCLKDQF